MNTTKTHQRYLRFKKRNHALQVRRGIANACGISNKKMRKWMPIEAIIKTAVFGEAAGGYVLWLRQPLLDRHHDALMDFMADHDLTTKAHYR